MHSLVLSGRTFSKIDCCILFCGGNIPNKVDIWETLKQLGGWHEPLIIITHHIKLD